MEIMPEQARSEKAWHERVSIERDRFAVLLHLHTLRELSTGGSWTQQRIMRELGLSGERTEVLLESLLSAGYLHHAGVPDGLALTDQAVSYLNGGAGRRRSVRLSGGSGRWQESR